MGEGVVKDAIMIRRGYAPSMVLQKKSGNHPRSGGRGRMGFFVGNIPDLPIIPVGSPSGSLRMT